MNGNMTGRDLILYILENGLEDKPVYENGELIGFMTIEEAAVKFEVGVATVRTWINMDKLYGINIGGQIYITANAVRPVPVVVTAPINLNNIVIQPTMLG